MEESAYLPLSVALAGPARASLGGHGWSFGRPKTGRCDHALWPHYRPLSLNRQPKSPASSKGQPTRERWHAFCPLTRALGRCSPRGALGAVGRVYESIAGPAERSKGMQKNIRKLGTMLMAA